MYRVGSGFDALEANTMLVFDAHLDLSWNAIDWKRDLEMSVAQTRAAEATMTELGRGTNTVSFPEMRAGNVGICVATVLARLHRPGNPLFGYATPEACYGVAQGQLAYYAAMVRRGTLRMIHTRSELASHADAWQTDPNNTPFGFILSMEGADPVLDPDQVFDWWNDGLRVIGLTHYGKNRYGGGTACPDGLEPEARPLLENIAQLGMALDLTHLSDKAFFEVVDVFTGRVLASHQNARRFVDDGRQFTDEQIRIVIERDGVIGAALDAWMLQPGWVRGQSRPEVTLQRVVDNIDHVSQLAGNARHAGIGSDLDGGFGKEQTPVDLDTIADLQRLPSLLERRGYSADAIRAVMHGNWLRFFGETLPPEESVRAQ
jgi:membrane dipeptidase